MKKVLIIISLTVSVSGVFAQNDAGTSTVVAVAAAAPTVPVPPVEPPSITSKKGEMYLPQAGDWAISMDATPWLNYLGNIFSSKGNNAPTAAFLNSDQTITCKYFKDAHTAYRLLVRIGINSYSQNQEIAADSSAVFPVPQVEDQRSISTHFIGLGAGIEKRKGNTRLQGYYGAEIMFYIAGTDTSFSYGNAYSASSNTSPTWWDWNSGTSGALITTGLPRPTQDNAGSTFGINLLAFAGVEYFIVPKISIGGEFTWGIGFHTTSQGSYAVEEINPITGIDQTNTYKTNGSSAFSLDNGLNQAWGNSSGSLYINFHF